MSTKFSFLFCALYCLAVVQGNAQEAADTAAAKTKVNFKMGVFYNSHLNYYGRTDSLKSQGLFPLAELWLNDKLYMNAAPVFVNNTAQSFAYAGTVATAGFRFGHDKKDAGNIYLVKPFYKENSGLVQSALQLQLAGTYSWLTKIINFTTGADVKLSDQLDYGLTAGIDHLFRILPGKGFVIVINPSASVNAGTQQFTKTYYKKSSFLLFPGAEQEVTEHVKGFNVLSYELSAAVVLGKGRFQAVAVPAYVIPQNLINVDGRPDLSERGDNLFYATMGLKMNF